MQGVDGGWAAFSRNQSTKIRDLIPFFKDDPPTPDVVGHVLSSLKFAKTVDQPAARRATQAAIAWLRSMQMADGKWFGRWGLTFTYGTTAVLQGLSDSNESMAQGYIRDGVNY